jgi:hypothetical protein
MCPFVFTYGLQENSAETRFSAGLHIFLHIRLDNVCHRGLCKLNTMWSDLSCTLSHQRKTCMFMYIMHVAAQVGLLQKLPPVSVK